MDSDYEEYSQSCGCLFIGAGEEKTIYLDAFLGMPEDEYVDQIKIIHDFDVYKIDVVR